MAKFAMVMANLCHDHGGGGGGGPGGPGGGDGGKGGGWWWWWWWWWWSWWSCGGDGRKGPGGGGDGDGDGGWVGRQASVRMRRHLADIAISNALEFDQSAEPRLSRKAVFLLCKVRNRGHYPYHPKDVNEFRQMMDLVEEWESAPSRGPAS